MSEYIIKWCVNCGKEFYTRNPGRVVCPDCLVKAYTEAINKEFLRGVKK